MDLILFFDKTYLCHIHKKLVLFKLRILFFFNTLSQLLTTYCGNFNPYCTQSVTFDTDHDQLIGSFSLLTAFPDISNNESGK